ncbi:MAG: hypothetical protein CSA05_03020 [Bacteroidia bacterium]|nr:MAG: hypothetical protein CSA05_03020 [Bacteroidia bacterium]
MEEPKYADKTEKHEITCKNCGSRLLFAPGTDSLACEYCGAQNKIEIKKEKIEEIDFYDFISKVSDSSPKQEVTTVRCEACGAETSFDENMVSQDCAFCGTPLIVKKGTTSNVIQPKSLLPFKVKNKEAIEMYKTWLKKLWFAPNKLKKYARQKGKISGMYIPYWTYDAQTFTQYTGQRGEDYQETETYTNDEGESETRTVTKTRWYPASGHVSRFFDDMLVVASKSLPEKYINKLEPWDLSNLLPFDEKFLSGFKTEKYQIDIKDGYDKAKIKMEPIIRQDIRNDIGGDHQQINTMSTSYDDVTFKHILLPLWISAYQFNNKIYRFMVNGRTGEVTGERPYSAWKIAFAILLALIIIGTIIYFVNKNQ